MDPLAHRRLVVCRGAPEETLHHAHRLVADLDPARVLWISPVDPAPAVDFQSLRHHLGGTFDAVVFDAHHGVLPDALGQAHGLIRGGGALLLRRPEGPLSTGPALREQLTVQPWPADAVGNRYQRFFESVVDSPCSDALVKPPMAPIVGTSEQRALSERLAHIFAGNEPSLTVLTADRGRGKSSALGLALARTHRRCAITALNARAAAEVIRFAGPQHSFVPLHGLLHATETPPEVIVIDEAAQIGVPLLQRIVRAHPRAHIAFATTTTGYEGTGRGFVLKFVAWLRALSTETCPLHMLTLKTPIRWASGDPLEACVRRALLLEAVPPPPTALSGPIEHIILDRDVLLEQPTQLQDFFGILVHAHYRTTPSDLLRMLDAPNVELHALQMGQRIVGASLVAREGNLGAERSRAVLEGRLSLRGHALPEMLIGHGGWLEAGDMQMVRSVRIAVHPALRRRGLGARLAEGVHHSTRPDLFGTLFGATPELIAFRRSLGYHLVQLGVSAGQSTGVPSAVMVKPASSRAFKLVERMGSALARDLPLQLALMQAGDHVVLDPELCTTALSACPEPSPLSEAERDAITCSVTHGRRPFESGAVAVRAFVSAHYEALETLAPVEQQLITWRVIQGRSWSEMTHIAGHPSIRGAMRGLRRALKRLVEHTLGPPW